MKKYIGLSIIVLLIFMAGSIHAFEIKAVWAHPGDLGKNEADVKAFFELLEKCHINLVFPLVKGSGGAIFWHSRKFPEAIHPDYKDFDMLGAAVKYARQYNIKIHPWLCDFTESKNSAAFRTHPEWAQLNPQGGYTSDEKLGGGRPYNPIWMCPVRKPGYVDQWLIPMFEEIVREYDVDGIHHDYVRYPGDVAPDSYCFCDVCLEHYMTYNHFAYTNRPDDRIGLKIVLPRKESNWINDLTLKPADWETMLRAEKARYLLEGKSINRNDLDYYFYTTRCDAITSFVKEVTDRCRVINPAVEVSAAVFINPMRSARHIGQRWTDFTPWVDILAPMNYRSHFQGGFEDYLAYLMDYVKMQMKWAGKNSVLCPGITGFYIYREEREPWEKALKLLESKGNAAASGDLSRIMRKNIAYLERFSKSRAGELSKVYDAFCVGTVTGGEMVKAIRAVLSDPPQGFFPETKFLRTIKTVKKSGAKGIVIFSAGILSRNKLWHVLETCFIR